jgi:hypothetical protein
MRAVLCCAVLCCCSECSCETLANTDAMRTEHGITCCGMAMHPVHTPAEVGDGILLEQACIVTPRQSCTPAVGTLLSIVIRITQEPAASSQHKRYRHAGHSVPGPSKPKGSLLQQHCCAVLFGRCAPANARAAANHCQPALLHNLLTVCTESDLCLSHVKHVPEPSTHCGDNADTDLTSHCYSCLTCGAS